MQFMYKQQCTKGQTKLFNALNKILGFKGVYLDEPLDCGGIIYYPDILLEDYKTIIEVDGASHKKLSHQLKDEKRSRIIRTQTKYRIIRVKDKLLLSRKNLNYVIFEIIRMLKIAKEKKSDIKNR